MLRHRGAERHESLPALVALALLDADLPGVTSQERERAGVDVAASIQAMPDVTRLGVRLAGRLASAVLSLVAGAPYSSLSAARRADVARKVFARRLPLVSEYGTLTGSLGLVAVVESRHAPGGSG